MAIVFSPAKINLFLAVTGRRMDGFHDLVSVAALLDFGDELEAVESKVESRKASGGFSLECDHPEVPTDGSNLILKAAAAFASATGWPVRQAQGKQGGVRFKLTKRIPVGAGLGGGSGNAVAALRALEKLSGVKLATGRLAGIAAGLGSDCALFLHEAPVVGRGRGERVEPLPAAAAARLRGRRVLVFKPSVGVGTAWAYGRMAARGADYLRPDRVEAKLAEWITSGAPAEGLLFNNMEPAVFAKFPALPLLLDRLRRETGLQPRMSGSGSACFALLPDSSTGSGQTGAAEIVTQATQIIRECWGPAAFVRETRILQM